MYDGVLSLHVPSETKSFSLAVDKAIVVVAKHQEQIVLEANDAIGVVWRWLLIIGF